MSEGESNPEDIAKLLAKKLRNGDNLLGTFEAIINDCFRNNPQNYPIGNNHFLDLTKSNNVNTFVNQIYNFLPENLKTASTRRILESLKEKICQKINKNYKLN